METLFDLLALFGAGGFLLIIILGVLYRGRN